MKKILASVVCALSIVAIAGCSSQQPQVITVTETAAPEPGNIYQEVLAQVWTQFTQIEKDNMCYVFNNEPETAWEAFDYGAEGAVPKAEFYTFFTNECSTY